MIITEYPAFSWSLSRKDISDSCMRKYFYNYYGSHNGWIESSPEINRMIYKYKQMTTLELVFGTSLHNSMKLYLQEYFKNNDMGAIFLKNKITNDLRDACKKGVNINLWNEFPKQNPLLMEHYYWGGFKSPLVKKIVAKVKDKLNNVYLFEKTKTIQELYNGEFLNVLELDESLKRTDVGSFVENDVKVFSKIDLLFIRKSDHKYIIVDWKTSNKQVEENSIELLKEDIQIFIYAYYVNKKYGIPYDQIVGRIEYVVTGETKEVALDDTVEKTVKRLINNSINNLSFFVNDQNLKKNMPKDISFFAQTSNEKKCNYCCYKKICQSNC